MNLCIHGPLIAANWDPEEQRKSSNTSTVPTHHTHTILLSMLPRRVHPARNRNSSAPPHKQFQRPPFHCHPTPSPQTHSPTNPLCVASLYSSLRPHQPHVPPNKATTLATIKLIGCPQNNVMPLNRKSLDPPLPSYLYSLGIDLPCPSP